MLAVATDPRIAGIQAAVAGKVVCVEVVAKLLIDAAGTPLVSERFGGVDC
jgi:hypothetical protein